MLPEDYKRGLLERLRLEADRLRGEKEARLRAEYSTSLEEIKREYMEAAKRFAEKLRG